MGVSGSGKSTLMNILGCLDRPTTGEYWLDGEEVSRLSTDQRARVRNRKIGFVFQSFNLLPRTSALDQVLMPLTYTAADLPERAGRPRNRRGLRCRGGDNSRRRRAAGKRGSGRAKSGSERGERGERGEREANGERTSR